MDTVGVKLRPKLWHKLTNCLIKQTVSNPNHFDNFSFNKLITPFE